MFLSLMRNENISPSGLAAWSRIDQAEDRAGVSGTRREDFGLRGKEEKNARKNDEGKERKAFTTYEWDRRYPRSFKEKSSYSVSVLVVFPGEANFDLFLHYAFDAIDETCLGFLDWRSGEDAGLVRSNMQLLPLFWSGFGKELQSDQLLMYFVFVLFCFCLLFRLWPTYLGFLQFGSALFYYIPPVDR